MRLHPWAHARSHSTTLCRHRQAQECTYGQLKTFSPKIGMALHNGRNRRPGSIGSLDGMSGLDAIARRLDVLNVAVMRLEQSDIVRHPLVAEILEEL